MKKSLFAAAVVALALVSCNKKAEEVKPAVDSAVVETVDSVAVVVDSTAAVVAEGAVKTAEGAVKTAEGAVETAKEEVKK